VHCVQVAGLATSVGGELNSLQRQKT
jgi:hypothetical protein